MQWRFFGRVFTWNFRVTKIESPVLGFRSSLNRYPIYDVRNRNVGLIDYDDRMTKKELKKEIRRLQRKFKLGKAKIATSSFKLVHSFFVNFKFPFIHKKTRRIRKFHVYFPNDVGHYFDWLPVIHFSNCDHQFKKWRMMRENMVLRWSPKDDGYVPELMEDVDSKHEKPDTGYMDMVFDTIEQERELIRR